MIFICRIMRIIPVLIICTGFSRVVVAEVVSGRGDEVVTELVVMVTGSVTTVACIIPGTELTIPLKSIKS